MKNDKEKINRFELHPVRTNLIIFFVSVIILDFSAANIYKHINGYPWSEKKQIQQEKALLLARKIEESYRTASDVYNHDLKKNMSVNNAGWGYLHYQICTNSLGFKDRAVRDIPLQSNKHRIVFIGDSFTEGTGFNYDNTFVGMIDKALSEKGIEVYNAALSSYCPIIYWKKIEYLIKNVGLKFNEVVVFIDTSDIQDAALFYDLDKSGNVVSKNEYYRDQNILLDREEKNVNFADRIVKYSKSFLKNNSILIYYFMNKLMEALNIENINYRNKSSIQYHRSLWTIDKNLYDEYGEKGLNECALYMDNLYNLLKSKGISLTVAVYPWPGHIIYDSLESIQVLYWRSWCAKHNVFFINYFPYFLTGKTLEEKEKIVDKYYLKDDVHLNRDGHKLIANIFLDYYNTGKNNQTREFSNSTRVDSGNLLKKLK